MRMYIANTYAYSDFIKLFGKSLRFDQHLGNLYMCIMNVLFVLPQLICMKFVMSLYNILWQDHCIL